LGSEGFKWTMKCKENVGVQISQVPSVGSPRGGPRVFILRCQSKTFFLFGKKTATIKKMKEKMNIKSTLSKG